MKPYNKPYSSAARDKNAELVIEIIRETKTFEGLYDLFEKLPDELSYLGHRIHECGKVFVDKLVKLAKTEAQMVIAILTLRKGWELNYGYGNSKILKSSAESVYWYIVPYLKKHLKVEIISKPEEPLYTQGEGARAKYLLVFEKHLLDIQKVSERYSNLINPKENEIQKSITALSCKLRTYSVCKMMFKSSPNSEAGLVLLRRMIECVDWHDVDLDEILYCVNAVANRRDCDLNDDKSPLWRDFKTVFMKLHNYVL
jgi:hypothetical protein